MCPEKLQKMAKNCEVVEEAATKLYNYREIKKITVTPACFQDKRRKICALINTHTHTKLTHAAHKQMGFN